MSEQKTEQPTQRRLQKAREQGQFPISKEFVSGVQFLVVVTMLSKYGPEWFTTCKAVTRKFLRAAFYGDINTLRLTSFLHDLVVPNLPMMAIFGGAIVGSTLVTQLMSTQLGFSAQKLAPDFSRLNPMSRLQQLPKQNFPAFFQAVILLPILLTIAGVLTLNRYQEFLTLPLGSVEAGSRAVMDSLDSLLWKAAYGFLVLGCIDLMRQLRKHGNTLRMSKQEVKDEHKESEGNPQMKGRIRKLQRDAARRNMMKAVPQATAVIVNPTHYAVAIQYQMDSMAAPKVVAKGKNYLALRIRKIALDHQVPIVENVPLAQALYKSANVGQEIPAQLYRAVAEILAYIFKLMNGKLPGQG